MPEMYEFKNKCKVCGKTWKEFRFDKPIKVYNKVCSECKSQRLDEDGRARVIDSESELRGDKENRPCYKCEHFVGMNKKYSWGHCSLGHENPREYEYTISYAIDNIDTCQYEKDEYEDYDKDIYGLVNWFDTCSDFSSGDYHD